MVNLLILIYFFLGSLYVTYPLISNFTMVLPGRGDEFLITWIINWNIHAFFTNPLNIFNANIYYPYLNSLAFSDAFFTSSIIAFLPLQIFKEPVVAYNFNFLFSLTTLGFFTYLFVFYLTKNRYSSIISGTLIAFSTYTLARSMHLQLISIQWIPLSLIFFIEFAKSRVFYYLILSALFVIIQAMNSFLPLYFFIFCFCFLLITFYFYKKDYFKSFINKKVFFLVLLIGLVSIALAKPYLKVSSDFNYIRDIRDTIHFANRLEYTFYPNDRTRFMDLLLKTIYLNDKGPYKYDGYLGGAIIILTLISAIYFIRKNKAHEYFDIFFLLGIFSFILSLGPAFQWGGKVIKSPFIIPLPYAVFYYLVPGFKGFRNSARFEMLAVFAFSIAVGLMFSWILKKRSLLFQFITTFVICGLVFLEFNFPFSLEKIPKKSEFPRIYSHLRSLPYDLAIIEFPIYTWDMLPYSRDELIREYYSTMHFRKMVNGGSGFSPPPWLATTRILATDFPNNNAIESLKNIKVKYIIIHKKDYKILVKNKFSYNGKLISNPKFIEKSLNSNKKVKLLKKIDEDLLYEIL